jgi:isoamylase
VPMLLAGDELGRTQLGNNNAYCQDNEVSWVDWEAAGKHAGLLDFTCSLISLRREHPAFRRRRFFSGAALGDITWLTPAGTEMTVADWSSGARSLAVLLNGEAITEPGPRGQVITDQNFLLLFNAADQPVTFSLPAAGSATGPGSGDSVPAYLSWAAIIDTTSPEAEPGGPLAVAGTVTVGGRAVVVLRSTAP